MRNKQPCAGVDWKNTHRIPTTTHTHITRPEELAIALEHGYELLTLSNYYPSVPYCPLSSMVENQFKVSQEHGIQFNGTFTPGPFNWNEIIAEWKDTLPRELQETLPFTQGTPLFPPLPPGIMECPNAEHHGFTDCDEILPRGFHITTPGCTWQSGHFDAGAKYHLKDHGYRPGAGLPWKEGFARILDTLVWEDGGGIVINHPTHTQIPVELLCEMLDFDDRVLGIEVWNTSQSSEEVWDQILSTGRQCFGFFVPDHFNNRSLMFNPVNILLTPERTPHACMQAYRSGAFYGSLFNGDLAFEEIRFEDDTLYVRTSKEAFLQILGFPGTLACCRGKELEYKINLPQSRIRFLRVKASDGTGEAIYSQAMLIE